MSDLHSQRLFGETLNLSFSDRGSGRPFLLLHGGAGPASMDAFAQALAAHDRAIVPVHPGFAGTSRPDWFRRVDQLALAYLTLLENLNLENVVVVGNSVGGWIAAEMAVTRSPRLAGIVLLNSVGLAPAADRPIVDPTAVEPAQRAALSFHNPQRYAFAPSGPQLAALAENQKALRAYAGEPFMHDPSLEPRLSGVQTPSLVLWGESDQIVDLAYGRRWADALPGAEFRVVSEAGHFPHIEKQNEVLGRVDEFVKRL